MASCPSWAAFNGSCVYGTWQDGEGRFHLGDIRGLTDIPLPGRGHDIAVSPNGDLAVVFARRPGRFLLTFNPATGEHDDPQWCPVDRHLFGHGVFSHDGAVLFVTENDFETGEGRIAVLDPRDRFRRIDDISSHGVGPHDLLGWPNSDLILVANGGIHTHPETGREKLNLSTMESSLVLLDPRDGNSISSAVLPDALQRLSLRHLDISSNGTVVVGGQWEGENGWPTPLVGVWDGSQPLTLVDAFSPANLAMAGYVGSVALNTAGTTIAATSPVSGVITLWDRESLQARGSTFLPDVCGLCADPDGPDFMVSTGLGMVHKLDGQTAHILESRSHTVDQRLWDNHLVGVA